MDDDGHLLEVAQQPLELLRASLNKAGRVDWTSKRGSRNGVSVQPSHIALLPA